MHGAEKMSAAGKIALAVFYLGILVVIGLVIPKGIASALNLTGPFYWMTLIACEFWCIVYAIHYMRFIWKKNPGPNALLPTRQRKGGKPDALSAHGTRVLRVAPLVGYLPSKA